MDREERNKRLEEIRKEKTALAVQLEFAKRKQARDERESTIRQYELILGWFYTRADHLTPSELVDELLKEPKASNDEILEHIKEFRGYFLEFFDEMMQALTKKKDFK